ncbi:hypothetical protein LCL85_19880 [Vibrio alginolyticus]|nr:hypothetical protein [Vibrio alginolyticus]
MPLFKDECFELGLPEPKRGEKEIYYVIRVIREGIQLNTRMARYIGIGNLHSIIPALKRKRVPFSSTTKAVFCPKLKEIRTHPVDVIWMTEEQRNAYWEMRKAH